MDYWEEKNNLMKDYRLMLNQSILYGLWNRLMCMCMESIIRKIVGLVGLSFIPFCAFGAEKVEVDGIYYNLNSNGTAEVTYRGEEEDGWMYFPADELYVGDLEIPDQIEVGEKSYQVTALGNDAFAGSKYLSALYLPSSLATIGSGAFTLCNGLEYISVDDMNPTFISQDGVLYKRAPLSIFFVPRSISGDIALLDAVREIPSAAFQNCTNLTTITLPEEVTIIADGAFNNCKNLQEIFMGEKLESVGEYAFSKCSSLSIVNFPTSLKNIKAAAFADCANLTYVLFHEGLENIGKMAFYNCGNIIGVQLPSTLTTIGEQAFKECVNLDVVMNDSQLPIQLGSTDYGYVAYYATQIIPDPQDTKCEEIRTTSPSCYRDGENWVILNASGKWVSIYTLTGQQLCRHFCQNEKEEIPLESPRIIVVPEER